MELAEEGLSSAVGRVVGGIEQRIRSGEYPAGTRLPGERRLAGEFGVSRITVRSAIRELQARGLVRHIPHHCPVVLGSQGGSAAQDRGAGAQQRGAESRTQRKAVLFLSYHGTHNPDLLAIYNGVRNALDPDRYLISLAVVGEDPREVDPVIAERMELQRVAGDALIGGVILWYTGGEENIPALQAVRESGRPILFVDRMSPPGFEADFVGVDNRGAAADIVRHLRDRGHQSIGHVTYTEDASSVRQRLAGYRIALAERGIPYRAELVQQVVWTVRGYVPPLTDLLRRWRSLPEIPPVTAVFALNDLVARQIIEAANEIGLRVPEDLAVAGFDGSAKRDPTLATAPTLTTVDQPMERIGREAGYLLQERMESGASSGTYRHVLLQAPLWIGGSTVPK